MAHIIGDVPDKMRKILENTSCQCGHPRDDHENREGKCKHKANYTIGYRLKGKKKILNEKELCEVRKSRKKRALLVSVYDVVPCCLKYVSVVARAGFTDTAFTEIFGGAPVPAELPPNEKMERGDFPNEYYDPRYYNVPQKSTTPVDPDVIIKPSTKPKITMFDMSENQPPLQGVEFTEEVQDNEGRNLVKPEYQEKVLTAPHKPKVATISNSASIIREVCRQKIIGSGLANWFTGLNADIISYKEMGENPQTLLEQYDWIMINLAGTDLGIPWKLREFLGTGSDTKLVVNDDYSVEIMQNVIFDIPGTSMYRFVKDILCADLFIAQEPYQLSMANYVIQWNKEKVMSAGLKSRHPITTMISHPVDTKTLKQFAVDDLNQRSPTIGVMYHRLDGQVFIPGMITRWQPPSWFNGMQPLNALYSYMGKGNIYASEDRLFDIHYEHLDFGRFIQMFVPNIAAFDYYTIHSHSRFSSECACFKVPLVSTTHSYNARILFPENVADYSNWEALRLKLARVISNEKYWQQCVDYAYERVEQFNLDNSIAKLSTVMEIVEKRK